MAGSSVFPTGGTSNPTLMAVALALRLADRLKASFTRMTQLLQISAHRGNRRATRARRAHRRRRADARLPCAGAGRAADRFEVVGVTSRTAQGREALAQAQGWQAFDSPHCAG